jgi:hypothetical protein
MTEIYKKRIGIKNPLNDMVNNETFKEAWKMSNCINGIHAFREILFESNHFLICDVCKIEVHIDHIFIPDGRNEKV